MHHDHTSDPAARGSAVLPPSGGHESGRRGEFIFLPNVNSSFLVFLSERVFIKELTQQACDAVVRKPCL